MFVLFIRFVLVLSISVSRAAVNKNVSLKDQLARSITHVREMLVDMEDKIEQERQILSQIDKNLNHEEHHSDEVLLPHPDYDSVTDIWWTSINSTGHHEAGSAATATSGKYGNVTIKTTPSLFPLPPQTSTFATRPSNWQSPTITESPFVADMKKRMALNRHGYFTAFAERVSELVYTKNVSDAYPVVHHVAFLMKKKADEGTFKSLGVDLLGGLTGKLAWFETLSPQRVKEQAGVLHYMLKFVDQTMPADLKSLLKFYDNMFTKEEGEELFESLEPFYMYPEGNITFQSMAERMFDAMSAPYIQSEGKRKQKRFVQHIIMATHEIDPYFRGQTVSSLEISDTNANRSTKDHNQTAFPERRSMNYKKIVKHFLLKHPTLFRKIKRQYKHDKKNEHRRFSNARKRHHSYRKSLGGHHGPLYDREQTRPRAYTESSYESENEKFEADSSESGPYYRENSKTHQQKNIHKVPHTQQNKIRLDKLKQHTQNQRSAQQKQWNLLKGTRSTTKLYQDDPQYLKQLAIRFLRNTQQRQNFYRNRRFNIPSSEEEVCNHSQHFEDSIENEMLHKIREASSYSDEEDHLRNNLYDALRHGNRTFVSFRKSDGGMNNKQTLRALSSETYETIKNNIYKVFEQEKKLYL